MRRLNRHALVLTLAVPAFAQVHHAAADSTDAAVAHLRTAVTSQRDGSHLPLLFSLRQLRDPSLRPLFERLVSHADWQVQVHAVLGLAEIDPAGHVNPSWLARISPGAQEAVIASAIDLQLLGVDQITQMLSREDVGDLPRLMLHAELTLLNRTFDHDEVQKLAEHQDLRVSGLASLLLAQSGDVNVFASFQSRYNAAAPRVQSVVLPWLLDAIRQYRLTVAADWLRSLGDDRNLSERDRQFVVLTAFEIDPARNLDLWRSYLGQSPSYSQRVRAGFMLLVAGEKAPPAAYDELLRGQAEDELLIRLAAAGRALATGSDTSKAMIELIDLGHPRTTEWVMSTLKNQDGPSVEQVYRHIIEQVEHESPRGRGGQAERVGLAVTASARLFALDPEWVAAKLLDAGSSEVLHQAILLGMFESDSPRAGEAAAALTTVGVGRESSLRTLLIAKHADAVSAAELRQLGMIAGGGGRVSDVLRAQAAWLYLKHAGKIDAALARLFQS